MRSGQQIILALLTLSAATPLAPGQFAAPNAKELPARDHHQGVTIAAVPIPDTDEAEKIFGKKAAPPRAGILPVELVILNERPEATRVTLERVQLLSNGDQFEQVEASTVALRLYPLPEGEPPQVGRQPRPPIPWPRGSKQPKDKKRAEREEAEAALRRAALRAAMIPAGATARGYLYFDLGEKEIVLERASVYIPEVVVLPSEEALLYFEIELKAYAQR